MYHTTHTNTRLPQIPIHTHATRRKPHATRHKPHATRTNSPLFIVCSDIPYYSARASLIVDANNISSNRVPKSALVVAFFGYVLFVSMVICGSVTMSFLIEGWPCFMRVMI